MRRITLFLCGLLIAASALCQTWKYTADVSTMTASIIGLEEGSSYSGPLNIPATINYGAYVLTVTSISPSAFKNYTGITSVIIPEGVKYIYSSAFKNCSAMESLTIPSTVIEIWEFAFNGCSALKNVIYNAKYASLINMASYPNPFPFYSDNAITTFIIGDRVQEIPPYLCCGVASIESIIIPRSVTSIRGQAFANCTKLTTVTFEPFVCPTISSNTFSGCSALTTINIPCGYSYPSYASKLSSYTGKLRYDRPAYTVRVSSDNNNFGTAAVTTSPNCDTYTVELTATPKTGYHFTHWSDNVTANPYSVNLEKDTTLTAYFEINKYNLKVKPNETARGTVTGVNGIYDHGSMITFEATANYGYHFTQWSDGIKTNPRTLTIVKDTTLAAIFDPNVYSITCGTSAYGVTEGAGKYDYLTEIMLTATPNYGYKFKQWSDGVTVNPRIVRVERDSVITAEYAPLDYQVVVKTADKKMGTVQPNSAEYPYLSQVELTAISKYGYHFTEWSDGSNQNPHTITVTKDTVFTANFAINSYDITILGSSYGTATGAGAFDYLTDIQIEAFPNYGYKFKSWSDGVKDNPRILTVESDTTLAMEFEPVKFTLRTQSNDDEKGTVTPSVGKYAYLSEVEIKAEPVYGYHFAEWGDGRIANPRKVVIESDTLFTAIFEVNTYSIQATTSAMGRITGAGEYDYLSECTLRATANYGYRFVSWKDGVTTNPRKITVTQDSIFAAIYEPVNFTIEAYSDNTKQGTVTPETQEVPYNSIAIITANAVHGYKFRFWDDYNTDNPREITVTEDATFIASFERDLFNVVVAESEYGTVTGDWRYPYQTYATIEATPNYGYQFVQWSDGNTDNPRTLQVNDDIYLSMVFEPAFFNIRTQADNEAHGYTTPKDTSAIYLSNIVISAIPNYGYHFTEWSDGNTKSERVITVTGNKTYMASFAPNTYSINVFANSPEYGSVSAPVTGSYLDEITISATPYNNYRFVSWSDGNTENPRVFTLTRDTAFMAVFEVANSGVCGDYWNLTWEYDKTEKILTISGNGTLNSNYEFGLEAANRVEKLIIAEGVTSIGASAFKDFTTIKHVSIPSTVKNIYEQAFYNCSNIEEIYCYRDKPAVAYSNTFDGIDKFSCTLHVLQSSVDMYKVATGWREFYYVESINSIETPLAGEEVIVEPAENTVTITWPTSENAATYTIEITKDGVVFCTLIFNGNGQLTGLAFAPGRNGNRHAPAAKMNANGMQFTVTGLNSATHYALTLQAKDDQNAVLASYSSEFTTTGTATAIDNTPFPSGEGRGEALKVLHNGQILILRGDKTYTLQGQEVK
ncbi:MAG: leucine-rich repeat protein [Paludibacteraceae bacterium]